MAWSGISLIASYQYACGYKNTHGSHYTGTPRENGGGDLCQGKHREFESFAKTQVKVREGVNNLTLKIKGIGVFAAKSSFFS